MLDRQRDGAPGRRELDGIAQQIVEDLLDLARIAPTHGQIVVKLQRKTLVAFVRKGANEIDQVAAQVGNGKLR